MERSKGFRSKTRGKLKKRARARGMISLSRILSDFKVGERVSVVIEPSIHKGMPHPKFQGLTGKVLEKRGNSYLIEIRDGGKLKRVISRPEHLKGQRG
ncbi:MAG: 50S ribosomal protein L21e [Candidatus Methanofastidiosia archaeon]